MAKKIKQAKTCTKCGKVLRDHNKTKLCSHHARMKLFKDIRKIRKSKGDCIDCNKKVEPIITYPAGNTIPPVIKHPLKCYDCRIRQSEYNKTARTKIKLKKESVTTL